MDADQFWKIIDTAKSRAGSDVDGRVEALGQQLENADTEELQSIQNHYDARIRDSYRWDLWGVAYLMNGGCSDDGFRYFRDWLVSEGRGVFESALASPESLARLPRVELAAIAGLVLMGIRRWMQRAA